MLRRDVKRWSRFIRTRLADAENRLQQIHSNSTLWMKIKWVLKRSSFLELLPELEGFQANLNLLVSVASLEALNCLKQSDAVVSEEERIKLEDEWYVVLRLGMSFSYQCHDRRKFLAALLHQDPRQNDRPSGHAT